MHFTAKKWCQKSSSLGFGNFAVRTGRDLGGSRRCAWLRPAVLATAGAIHGHWPGAAPFGGSQTDVESGTQLFGNRGPTPTPAQSQ
eukprot:4840893-Amphidinium_carterae.1